jgi:Right handed beta helix region
VSALAALRKPGSLRSILASLAIAYFLGQSCQPVSENQPTIQNPPLYTKIATDRVYVSVTVLPVIQPDQTFTVELTLEGQQSQDVTDQFTLAGDNGNGKDIYHALLPVPLGSHSLHVTQHLSSGSNLDVTRYFPRVLGPTQELGLLDRSGQVFSQRFTGVLTEAPGLARLYGTETTVPGEPVLASTEATTTDTDPSDGLDLTYFDEPNGIQTAIPLDGEDEVWPTGPFLANSGWGQTQHIYYARIDSTVPAGEDPVKGVGIAAFYALGSVFLRLHPGGQSYFDDADSLFDAGVFGLIRGVVDLDGGKRLLYGVRAGTSGQPEDSEVILARYNGPTVYDPDSYEFWADDGSGPAWSASPDNLVPLWTNSSAPTVNWNDYLGRWVAVHSIASGVVAPYVGPASPESTIAIRLALDPEGPWSEPVPVWGRPRTNLSGAGSARDPLQLAYLDTGESPPSPLLYITATDDGQVDPSQGQPAGTPVPPNPYLYVVDLSQLTPLPPNLVAPAGPTDTNPHAVTGYAAGGDHVTLYVNDVAQGSGDAAGDGSFSIPAVLLDGDNTVFAIAETGGRFSQPSNTIVVEYVNTIPRTQSGTIAVDTVWTPGNPPTPYVIDAPLEIQEGATLTILPGTTLEMGVDIDPLVTVRGSLQILGEAGNEVYVVRDPNFSSTEWGSIRIEATSPGATVEHAIFQECNTCLGTSGANLTVADSSFVDFAVAIDMEDFATGTITGNTFSVATREGDLGILLVDASPEISNNTFAGGCELDDGIVVGIEMDATSSPNVVGNAIHTCLFAVSLINGPTGEPHPTVNGNDLISTYSPTVYAGSDLTSPGGMVDMRNNYWGTADPVAASEVISDIKDDPKAAPFVDFMPIWSESVVDPGANPQPVDLAPDELYGFLSASLAIDPGTTDRVLSALVVPETLTLSAGPDAILAMERSSRLVVRGTLDLNGLAGQPVRLQSAEASPSRGNWRGIWFASTSLGSELDFAEVWHARDALWLDAADLPIRDSAVEEFSQRGVWLQSGANATITNAVVLNTGAPTGQTTGIELGSPGVGLGTETATITGSSIRGLSTGVRLNRTTNITIHDNEISGNSSWNFDTNYATPIVIDAERNYWGTTEPSEIGAMIRDVGDGTGSQALVDFVPFLTALGGQEVGETTVFHGPLTTSTPLTDTGGPYHVVDFLRVEPGVELSMAEGTVVGFSAGSRLEVDGTLTISGSAANPVSLLPDGSPGGRGHWEGVVIAGATGSQIAHAVIDSPEIGIAVTGGDVIVQDTRIQEFATAGLSLVGTSMAQIQDNVITNEGGSVEGKGIFLDGTATLIGNTITNALTGIHAASAATGSIDASTITILQDDPNATGIWIDQNALSLTNNIVGDLTQGRLGVGIALDASASVVSGSVIDYSETAIEVNGGAPTLSNNQIHDAQAFGIDLADTTAVVDAATHIDVAGTGIRAANSDVTVSDSWIENVFQTGIELDGTTATIDTGTHLDGAQTGIQATNSSITIDDCVIENFSLVGIDLVDTSGTILGTDVWGADIEGSGGSSSTIGIRLMGTSSPTVGPQNRIEGHATGIWIKGGGLGGDNPLPTINQNNLSHNAEALHLENYDYTQPSIVDARENWWGSTDPTGQITWGGEPSELPPAVDYSDFYDNDPEMGGVVQPAAHFTVGITGIRASTNTFRSGADEQVEIRFELLTPDTVTVSFYPELLGAGSTVRTVQQTYAAPGSYALPWDGRDASGDYVDDEAYVWVIDASSLPVRPWDPPVPNGAGAGAYDAGTPSTFNVYQNDFWKQQVHLISTGDLPVRVKWRVDQPEYFQLGSADGTPFFPGYHTLVFDGRNPDGDILTGNIGIWVEAPTPMPPHVVIVQSSAPAITGPAPQIEVKSNPYLVRESYDQASEIVFELDQDATVTMKLLRPGETDPNNPLAVVDTLLLDEPYLVANGPRAVTWRSDDPADPKMTKTDEEGAFTFTIEAQSTRTGKTSLYRGILQLRN